jgi:hypothetical protein
VLTYFKCGCLSHKSAVCHSITLIPSSFSPPLLFHLLSPSLLLSRPSLVPNSPSAIASRSRVLRFLENDLSAKTKEDLYTGVILEARGFLREIF